MVSVPERFLQGLATGESIQTERQQAPIRNRLAQLQLQGAEQQAQQAQQQQGIDQEMRRLQFIHNASLALRKLPLEQRDAAFDRLSPLAQQIGINPNQFPRGQFTNVNLDQSIATTTRFMNDPASLSAEVRSLQEKSRILESAVDPETGGFLPDEQLSPQQRIVLRQEGLRGRAPSVTAEQVGERERAKLRAQQDLKPQLEASIAEAKVLGQQRGEDIANFPKDLISLRGKLETADNVIKKVDQALDQIGFFSTGFAGAVLSGLPGSDSQKLRATVDTIKANLGFDRLQEMREASKTGGALGSITEIELQRLESAVTNLDPNQGDEILSQNLAEVLEKYERFRRSQIDDVVRRSQNLGVNIEEAGGLPTRAQEILQDGQQTFTTSGGQTVTFTVE